MAGTPNVGTLVGAAIRPINTADLISTAYANEIQGGIHGYATLTERNNIIIERRQWGMLAVVYNDSTNNKTYQLKYDNVDTDLMNNLNWVEYTGASSTNISEWQNSVKSILTEVPTLLSDGDRYLVGLNQNSTITGVPWAGNSGGFISQYNFATNTWTNTNPTNGMTVRVDDKYNSLYKYEGDYFTGQWIKEKLTQVYSVDFIGNGVLYTSTISPTFSQYDPDTIFLSKFDISNTATISVNINGVGIKMVKKPSNNGLVDLTPNDIVVGNIYSLSYDLSADCFQFIKTYSNDSFNIKYYIEPNDYIVVPPYCQYWVYGDLTVDGTILNYGKIIVADGELIIGTFGIVENYGDVDLISVATDDQPVFNSIIVGGPTSSGGVVLSATAGNLTINDVNFGPKYKVYTALLTQNGTSQINGITEGDILEIGITYLIVNDNGVDLSFFGAPNNSIGTYFICTNTGVCSDCALSYDAGAPVVIVLENTIGNIWFTYYAVGQYKINSNGLLPVNKRQFYYGLLKSTDFVSGFIIESDEALYNDDFIQIITRDSNGVAGNGMTNTPIEIRVYN